MKKALALILVLCITVFGTSLTAFAADVSIAPENLGRGAGVATVTANADGSITSATSNISFYLPEAVQAGETVTVHVTGSSDGDFRVWLIDVNEVTNSDIYQMSQNDFTSGEFDRTFDLTATAEATEIFFKAPSWDAAINNLTIASLSVGGEDAADVAEEADVEEVAEEPAAVEVKEAAKPAAAAPKTGETSNAVVYIALAAIAAVGFVATKKKTVKE